MEFAAGGGEAQVFNHQNTVFVSFPNNQVLIVSDGSHQRQLRVQTEAHFLRIQIVLLKLIHNLALMIILVALKTKQKILYLFVFFAEQKSILILIFTARLILKYVMSQFFNE